MKKKKLIHLKNKNKIKLKMVYFRSVFLFKKERTLIKEKKKNKNVFDIQPRPAGAAE